MMQINGQLSYIFLTISAKSQLQTIFLVHQLQEIILVEHEGPKRIREHINPLKKGDRNSSIVSNFIFWEVRMSATVLRNGYTVAALQFLPVNNSIDICVFIRFLWFSLVCVLRWLADARNLT